MLTNKQFVLNRHAKTWNRVYTWLAVLVAIFTTACTPTLNAGGAAANTAIENGRNGITVIGMGEAIGQPDQANITVGVETFSKEVELATGDNETTIQAILAALKEQGIAAEDMQTANYSLWAEQLYGDNGPEGIAGYRISNQVHVIIRDIDNVSDVLSAAISAGANNIYGVTFSVADPLALEAEARETAVANARERAESLAQLNGLEVGDVLEINEAFISQMPFSMMNMGGGGGGADASISPGQLSYQVQVQITYAIR